MPEATRQILEKKMKKFYKCPFMSGKNMLMFIIRNPRREPEVAAGYRM